MGSLRRDLACRTFQHTPSWFEWWPCTSSHSSCTLLWARRAHRWVLADLWADHQTLSSMLFTRRKRKPDRSGDFMWGRVLCQGWSCCAWQRLARYLSIFQLGGRCFTTFPSQRSPDLLRPWNDRICHSASSIAYRSRVDQPDGQREDWYWCNNAWPYPEDSNTNLCNQECGWKITAISLGNRIGGRISAFCTGRGDGFVQASAACTHGARNGSYCSRTYATRGFSKRRLGTRPSLLLGIGAQCAGSGPGTESTFCRSFRSGSESSSATSCFLRMSLWCKSGTTMSYSFRRWWWAGRWGWSC